MILAFHQRRLGDLHETGKIRRINASEALADIARSRRRSLSQLIAQPKVPGQRRPSRQLIDASLKSTRQLPRAQFLEFRCTHATREVQGKGQSISQEVCEVSAGCTQDLKTAGRRQYPGIAERARTPTYELGTRNYEPRTGTRTRTLEPGTRNPEPGTQDGSVTPCHSHRNASIV